MAANVEPNPAVSVVIVSDYASGEAKSWYDLRAALAALARQKFDEPVEVLVCEQADIARQMPADIAPLLPSLKIISSTAASSYELKNDGARAASADIIGIIDADCIPAPDWLQHLTNAMRKHPDAVAVSGRTEYPGGRLVDRLLALLSRAYLDPGRAATTRFISNNNMGFRRSAFLACPLPTDAGPFASRLQSEAILRSGGKLLFEPRMRVTHDFEGWPMETDIRRNVGYGTVVTRLRDRSMPYAWLTRLGYASIPLFALGKILKCFSDCIRCARHYRVRWYELPAAFCLAVVVHLMEIPGMITAFRGKPLCRSAYR